MQDMQEHYLARPSGRPRQLLLHCSTSCIHAVVRTFKIIPDDFVELAAPDEKERFEAEIREVRRENLRLKAELHQVKEDREILKKAAAYFAKNPD